jgi:cold shock CspA family protein
MKGMPMETPLEIDFQGMSANDGIRTAILSRIAGLEERYGRITACRVVVKGPGEHHRKGGLYEINIRMALPNGREVNVGRTAKADERHADIEFALGDAFKRARRRLQDEARELQGQVKAHDTGPAGTVAMLDTPRGFGFIATADGREVYFHRNSVLDDGFKALEVGTRVSFAEEPGEKGPQASTVRILGKHGLR